jgi:hypothetical protein
MAQGFFFDYLAVNRPFKPAVVVRPGATTSSDCLAEFSQIDDAAWFLGDITPGQGLTAVAVSGADVDAKFDSCVAACKANALCQFLTFDYPTGTCYHKLTVTEPAPAG